MGRAEKPDPHQITEDYVGPPDKSSNMRPYVRYIKENETNLEKTLRLRRIEVDAWNNDFWSKHNKRFYEVRQSIKYLILQKDSFCISSTVSGFYGELIQFSIHVIYSTTAFCNC